MQSLGGTPSATGTPVLARGVSRLFRCPGAGRYRRPLFRVRGKICIVSTRQADHDLRVALSGVGAASGHARLTLRVSRSPSRIPIVSEKWTARQSRLKEGK